MPKRKYIHEVYTRTVYGKSTALQRAVLDSKDLLQRLQLDTKLQIHEGCVNTIVWNEAGSLLLSGSDDHNLVITDIFQPRPISNVINTPHTANIISAQFISGTGDTKVVSCADSTVLHTDVNKPQHFSALHCHSSKVYEVVSVCGDPHSFLTCGEDGTVRWVDTRVHPECSDGACQKEVIVECDRGVGSICLNPLFPWELAVGCSDSCVRIYDRRMLSTKSVSTNFNSGLSGLFSKFSVPELDGKSRRITSVKYRQDGKEVLVSFSSDYLYIFNPRENLSGKKKRLKVGRPSHKWRRANQAQQAQQPVKKFRLRGDWSDTGPRSRPEAEANTIAQPVDPRDRVSSQAALMQRMTFALSRMLNDPGTRLAMQRLGSGSRNREESSDSTSNESPASTSQGTSGEPREQDSQGSIHRGETGVSTSVAGSSQGTSAANSLPQPQSLEASSASLIQERWRQYRERKMAARAREVIEVETTDHHLADSLMHPAAEEMQETEVLLPQDQNPTGDANDDNNDVAMAEASGEAIVETMNLEEESVETVDEHETETVARVPVTINVEENNDDNVEHDVATPGDVGMRDNNDENQSEAGDQKFSRESGATTENVGEGEKPKEESNVASTSPGKKSSADEVASDVVEESKEVTTGDKDEFNSSVMGETTDGVGNGSDHGGSDSSSEEESSDEDDDEDDDSDEDDEENDGEEEGPSRNLASLVTSYSNLVQSGVRPNLQIRYSEEGANTSSIQLQSESLPGPMRVVTGQGQSGVDPVTGARRRRIGVSSVSTSAILPEEQARTRTEAKARDEGLEGGAGSQAEEEEEGGLVEYESDVSEEDGESDDEGEGGRTILQPPVINKFTGHRNVRTLILEGAWWGENYVLSGSDCGHFFAWDRSSAEIVLMREADRHVVNRVRPHPVLPILASSGIDHDVKIWSPTSPQADVTTCEDVEVVTRRNQVMLEETRDTITVPASLMIRMLASLNQIRRGERESGESRNSS